MISMALLKQQRTELDLKAKLLSSWSQQAKAKCLTKRMFQVESCEELLSCCCCCFFLQGFMFNWEKVVSNWYYHYYAKWLCGCSLASNNIIQERRRLQRSAAAQVYLATKRARFILAGSSSISNSFFCSPNTNKKISAYSCVQDTHDGSNKALSWNCLFLVT